MVHVSTNVLPAVEHGKLTRLSDGVAGGGQVFEGRKRIADHGGDVERAYGLIEGPEGLGAIGIVFVELVQLGMGQLPEWDPRSIDGAQEREGVESGGFQSSPEIRGDV